MVLFQGYRHGFSCNNLKDVKGSKIAALYRKDPEPSLTMWGILQCLDKSIEISLDSKSQIVFVSPLVRTWLTATLLFLPHTNNLKLQIAPYLKEHHQFSGDTGNLPATPEQQVNKYTEFLNYLLTINRQVEDPKDSNILSNLKKLVENGKTITIIDSFHDLEPIQFTYNGREWIKREDNYNSRFGGGIIGGRNFYVGKIAKQNVWGIKFHAVLEMATTSKYNYKSVVGYRDIQIESGKNAPNKDSVSNLRSSCENLCEFTGPSMSFGKTCDAFSFMQVYNTYIHQTNDVYTVPQPVSLQQINQIDTDGTTLTKDDYYSTDITKFVEWILKHDEYKKMERVFFVSHNQSLQDLSDKLSQYNPMPLILENLPSADIKTTTTASMTHSSDDLPITVEQLKERSKPWSFWPFTRKGGKRRRGKKQRKTLKKSR